MQITSRGFGKLLGVGTRNKDNRIAPEINTSKRVEVKVDQDYRNTPINLQILVGIKRSKKGSRRVASLELNGAQARELYQTLSVFFEDFNQNTKT